MCVREQQDYTGAQKASDQAIDILGQGKQGRQNSRFSIHVHRCWQIKSALSVRATWTFKWDLLPAWSKDSYLKKMEPLFAKALYDNTAESEDELAFRKGDIIMVLERNVPGSIGWWKCSLHGRQGLAPANRLCPLPPGQSKAICTNFVLSGADRDSVDKQCHQNIYQTPKTTKPQANHIYEDMNCMYKVPSVSPQPILSPERHMMQDVPAGNSSPHEALTAHPRTDAQIYDVPSLVRKNSVFTPPVPRPMRRNPSLMSPPEIQKTYEMLANTRTAGKNVYTTESSPSQDPNYDIPMPTICEDIQKPSCGYSTIPKPSKSGWIYDVPVSPQKQGVPPGHYGTLPSKIMNSDKSLYDILPSPVRPDINQTVEESVYDIPKPSRTVQSCKDSGKSKGSCIYDVPPCIRQTVKPVVFPKQKSLPEIDSFKSHEPLGKPRLPNDQLHCWPLRARTVRRDDEDNKDKKTCLSTPDNQRSSTVSTSSTASSSSRSSCDSFMLSSPEPEPLREITLSQEEAGNRLLELQEAVCQAAPKLMLFVSSHWRSKEHLGQHLQQIRTAAEDVTNSVTSFLTFAVDVRGNAQRLTDSNLQTRLLKQLSIVEDSGLILQQAADALRDLGWRLDALVQDSGQSQTPDHLERFVMVARTVPEDLKRLVSILNANGKLLFKTPAKEPDIEEDAGQSDRRDLSKSEPMVDSGIDENDYVQLQTKTEFEQQLKTAKASLKSKRNGDTPKKQVSKSQSISPSSPLQISRKPSISDHCRLYFGAIQKAINVFISSLTDGQPPEKFISHSKLVIMVGQRLVNTLCSEAKSKESNREMLSMSNQLCAHLKQLAIVTKTAALKFPDKPALQEAQDIAKELAQRTQQYRMSLEV